MHNFSILLYTSDASIKFSYFRENLLKIRIFTTKNLPKIRQHQIKILKYYFRLTATHGDMLSFVTKISHISFILNIC